MRFEKKNLNKTGMLLVAIFFLVLFLLPGATKGQSSSDLLKEYLFPIQYDATTQADVIGLRIYKNLDNKDPLTWYLGNVSNPKSSLPVITIDGYRAVRDDRTIYIQASNWSNLSDNTTFFTNIYVLAYNQNASAETINIFNQMLANIKFNKNVMDLYCLKSQYEAVKDSLRRDTIRKSDYYNIKNVFANFSGQLNLQAGTYVANMSISTWPSWQATLAKQLGTALPIDPLNIMAVNLVTCASNADCGAGQCSGGYCSACKPGWDARTCWNERTQNYQPIDGFVYKYQNGVLTIRYEYPQIVFPAATGCTLGCLDKGVYYNQGSCLTNAQYCDSGNWTDNTCGDGLIRCNEVCEGANCVNCLACEDNYHAVGSMCEEDTNPITALTQTLSTSEQERWTGSGWSAPYAIACKVNAVLDNVGVCHCKINFHELAGECLSDNKWFSCGSLPIANTVWNTVGSYQQGWDGTKWVPEDMSEGFAPEYNDTGSDSACRYKCAENFTWNGTACTASTRTITCSPDKPANAVWNNGVGSYTQTWDSATSSWLPSDSITGFDVAPVVDSCHFICATNYTWNVSASACQLNPQNFVCNASLKPAHADWNTVSQYTQTWNGAAWAPPNSTTVYNPTADSNSCRFKCALNSTWDGAACPCDSGFLWDGSACNAVCGDKIVVGDEPCDDGVPPPPAANTGHNGEFGFCNSTCTGLIPLGSTLFYDNFENLAFTNSNWQINQFASAAANSIWTPYFLQSDSYKYKFFSSADDGNRHPYDNIVTNANVTSVQNVDVLMMADLPNSSLKDAFIIVRRTGSGTAESYYTFRTNNGSSANSPNVIQRMSSGSLATLITDTTDPLPNLVGKYWLRFQIYNNASTDVVLNAMWWPVGDPMPATWNLSYIDIDTSKKIIGSGSVGLAGWVNSVFYFDNFQVYPYIAP